MAAELAVIYLLEKNGWNLQFQRSRTEIAEVDLIFLKNKLVFLIEVKKLNDDWRSFQRIPRKQYQSLQKNLILFSNRFKEWEFRAYVSWVDIHNKVSFVSVE